MIPAERAHLKAFAISHAGMSGKNNEDRYAVAAFRTGGERPASVLFAIVSDGIGGHRAGEVASEMVVESISQAVAQGNADQPVQTLREAIMRASQQILVRAESDFEMHGMGATCACALIVNDRLYIAYVGDSRIYLIRGDEIRQISIDHTWVQEAIDVGILTSDQRKDHPNSHVIRRYLGSKQPVDPDTRLRLNSGEDNAHSEANQGLHLRPNDRIVLCSDGLTDLVKDEEIRTTLSEKDQEKAIKTLVDLANQRGGHDNITIVSVVVPDNMPEATQPISVTELPIPSKRRSVLLIATAVLLVLAILLAAGSLLLFLNSSTTSRATPASTLLPAVSLPAILPTLAPAVTGEPLPAPTEPLYINPTGIPVLTSGPVETIHPSATMTRWSANTNSP